MLKYILVLCLLSTSCGILDKQQSEHEQRIKYCKTYNPQTTDYGNGIYILTWNECWITDDDSVGRVLAEFKNKLNTTGLSITSISPKYDSTRYHDGFIITADKICK